MKQPYEWQENAVTRFASAAYGALACACGTGKTLALILIALVKQKPTIVVTPGHSLCDQWRKAIEEEDPRADVWVYSKPEETRGGDAYRGRFEEWLSC